MSGWNLPYFSGAEIDGTGHTLSNLSVNQPYNDQVGFVGTLESGSSLHDIVIVDASVRGGYWAVGGLVGWNMGDVSNSHVTGAVAGYQSVGGLIGENYGTITRSFSAGTVTASDSYAGGLVGRNYGQVTDSFSQATSVQGASDVGGLFGTNWGTSSNSHYNIDQTQINGVAGVVTEGGLYGSQFADWQAGGLSLNVTNYLTTDANGYYQLGSVQNLKDMLGFVDAAGSKFHLTSDIDLTTIPGWLIPVFRGAEIDGAGHVLSNLSVNQPYNPMLGLIGHLPAGGVIRNVAVEGANIVGGAWGIGALVGYNEGSIETAYSTGYVTGAWTLGGLVGQNDGSILNSFSTVTVDGAVQSAGSVGGLVGENYGSVTNSYASGAVSGSATGGLIGYNNGTVTAGVWNTETSGQSVGIGTDNAGAVVTAMTSAQMADSANFAGWNFSGVWSVVGGVPRLQGVGQSLTNIWTGLSDGHDWFAAGNWSLGHAPTASELVSIPDVAGTTQIDINSGAGFSVRSVTSAEFLFVAGAGTSFLLTEGGTLNAGLRIGSGAMLTSIGNLVIAGGNSQIDAGGSLIANAGLNLVSPATLTVDGLLRANTLTTPGILTLRDASQLVVDTAWSHTGTLNVSGAASLSGPLDIDGGNVNLAAGSSLSSSDSAVRWNGGTIAATGSLDLQGEATLAIDAFGSGARVLAGPDLRVDTFDLAAGSVEIQQGTLRLPNGGTVAAGRSLMAYGGGLDIGGVFSIAGDVITQGNATLLASAPVTVEAGGLLRSGGGSMRFTDALVVDGTLEAFAGVTRLDGTGTYTHGGTFRSLPGASLVFGAGTHRFGDGSVFDLNGTLVNNSQFVLFGQNSGLTVAAGSLLNLGVANFSGNGVLNNLGTVSADGVAFSGRLLNAGTANLRNGTALAAGFYNMGDLNIVSGTVTALGATSELAGGAINLGSGATLEKSGGTLLWSGGTFGGSGTLAFTNGGLIGFSGNGDRILDNANLSFSFTNLSLPSGSLRLQSGNLSFNTTAGNSTLLPVGTELTMAGGTLTNNGPLDVSGLFGLYGGTLAGAGAINMTGGTIDLPANSTVNWTATGAMSNSGTLNLSNRTITNAITNNGTINTTGGLVFTQLFTNHGTFNLNSGTTTFSAGFQQNSGSTKLGTGAGTSANAVAGGSGFNLAGGTLSGSGNLTGDLNVGNGIVSVGFSPGSLNITGNLNLSAGSTTNIELGGTAPGTGYDTIAVSGTANLAGTLNVTSYGGYVPAAGSSYNFMSFGSSTGAFGSTNLPAGWAMSMNSASTYLQLLMAAAQAAGVSPLQALIQALAPASGSAGSMASDPGATTMGATSLDFSRVTPNDLATSLMQQVMGVTQVLPSTDFEDLKVCQ